MTRSVQPSDMHTVGVHHVCDHDIKRHVNYGIHFRLTWKVNGHYRRDILLQYHKCQQPTNTQDVFCVLTKQYTAFKSTEVISVYQVLQGSAESLIGRGGTLYRIFAFYKTFTPRLKFNTHS